MEIIVHRNMYVTRCGFKKKNLIRAELSKQNYPLVFPLQTTKPSTTTDPYCLSFVKFFFIS
jgi:hypothetical protein